MISVRTNILAFQKKLGAFAYKQLPYAESLAITELAKMVQVAERNNMVSILDRPTPFTQASVKVKAAKKSDPTAIVWVQDIAAEYLEPYQFGGKNKLNSKALLKPVGESVNEFGNLPRKTLAKLKSRSDVFVGVVKTKTGQELNGVWQRSGEDAKIINKKTGKVRNTTKGINNSGHLKLLIEFTQAHEVKQNLDWFNVADHVVKKNFNRVMGRALARAIATAK